MLNLFNTQHNPSRYSDLTSNALALYIATMIILHHSSANQQLWLGALPFAVVDR